MSLIDAMDDAAQEEGYRPTEEYEEEFRDPLVDISLTDSTELWLIQWPYKQELSLKLHGNGRLGSFEDSSGKVYDVLGYDSPEPDATVFLTSASEPKSVGKISKRVSLVHYPEPKELEEVNARQSYAISSGVSLLNPAHRFSSPGQSSWRRNSHSTREHSSYTHSSRYKSSNSKMGEPSKPSKRRHVDESNRSVDRSTLDSGGHHSGVTSLGSSEHLHQGKLKKKMKYEE
ncbi:mediator-associated protein 2 [Melia azedarach]|uniref:Mediator-associated protein 2 n=1 Tax=Melia azedarach TaxID=155640 RepID=A0ACC1Y9F9_MELAZ|nr:mediator-associated protein 2 [Melia azedarach]